MTQYIFQLPIELSKDIEILQESINTDIELFNNKHNKSIYNILFKPSTKKGKDLLQRWTKQFSYNTDFLLESQTLYREFSENKNENNNVDLVNDLWTKFKQQENFLVAYNF